MNKKYEIGTVLSSERYGDFQIIKIYDLNHFRIKFIKTGYEKDISRYGITTKKIRDPYFPVYCGVACLGEIKLNGKEKYLSIWRFMIYRCYDPNHDNYKLYGGKGITVCNRWLCFQFFYEDVPQIRGFNEEKFNNGLIVLDKDLNYFGDGNKQYSLKSCIFISKRVNFDEMLARRKLSTSSRYVGVTKLKDGKWQVTLCTKNGNIYLGRYSSEYEAHKKYEEEKKKYYDALIGDEKND